MVRKKINQDDISQDNIELPEYLEVHNIHTYIKDNTEIMYSGILYDITYKNNITTVTKRQTSFIEDDAPKIMYIPSERNLLSYLENPSYLEKVSYIPGHMRMFIAEYLLYIKNKVSSAELPIQNLEYIYDNNKTIIYIQDKKNSYKIPLNHASSGIQSMLPLFIVTKYLTEFTSKVSLSSSSSLSIENLVKLKRKNKQDILQIENEIKQIKNEIEKRENERREREHENKNEIKQIENEIKQIKNEIEKRENGIEKRENKDQLSLFELSPTEEKVEDIKKTTESLLKELYQKYDKRDQLKELYQKYDKRDQLKELYQKYDELDQLKNNRETNRINHNIYNSFTNIIEEPELNLHPQSQDKITYWLLKCNNTLENNQLIITTHSPYIINYVSLAIKAYNIQKKIDDSNINDTKQKLYKEKLYQIIDKESCIEPNTVSVYEVKNGGVKKLKTYGNGIPSDDNELNNELAAGNDIFSDLLEIENEVDNNE